MSSQLRISLSKTNYTGTVYNATTVDIDPGDESIRVTFPVLYANFERGQRVYLTKPGNSDWDGEYYIQLVTDGGGFTILNLRFRAGTIRQSTPAGPGTGTITESEYDWTIYNDIFWNGIIREEKEDGCIFYRKKLKGPISLTKTSRNFINGLLEECYPYLIYVKIEKVCDGTWIEDYIGAFTINDVKWNQTRCTTEIMPYTFDQYFSYFKLYREQNNIMEIATRYQAELGGALQFGDRWIKLEDLLDYFAGQTMYNVKSIQSDFFGINPVGYVYPVVIDTSDLGNVMISAMPDVNTLGATNQTEFSFLSFFDFLENLKTIFGVYWDVVNGVLILENEYYFTSTTGIDISTSILNRKDEYNIELDKIPRQETFKFGQGYNTDFTESTIVYNDEILSNQLDGGQKVTYTANGVTTDLGWVYNVAVGASISQTPSDDGIILGAFDTVVNGGTGSYPSVANLTWHYLIARFHQYFRPRLVGYYYQSSPNRTENTFASTKRALLRKDIVSKLCCEDFESSELVQTEWGNAEVKSVERNLFKGTATFDLLFELPC